MRLSKLARLVLTKLPLVLIFAFLMAPFHTVLAKGSVYTPAPDNSLIEISSHAIVNDTGGTPNLLINPGETIELSIGLINTGTSKFNKLDVTVSSSNPHVTMIQNFWYLNQLKPGIPQLSMPNIVFALDNDTPTNESITLDLRIEDTKNKEFYTKSLELPVQSSIKSWKELDNSFTNGLYTTPNTIYLQGLAFDNNDVAYLSWNTENATAVNTQLFDGTNWQDVGTIIQNGGYLDFDSNNVAYITYWQKSASNDDEIYVKYFDGAAWQELAGSGSGEGISNNNGDSIAPKLAFGNDNKPYVVWHDNSGTNWEIYVKYFDGTNWVEVGGNSGSNGGVSNNSGDSFITDIVTDSNGYPIVAWEDRSGGGRSIYVRKFDGVSWNEYSPASATAQGITNSTSATFRSIAIDSNDNLYVASVEYLSQGSNEDVVVYKYDGSNWSDLGNTLSSGGIGTSGTTWGHVDVHVDDNDSVYVAWSENGPTGYFQAYVKKFDGVNWVGIDGSGDGVGLSDSEYLTASPRLDTDSNGNILVGWIEEGTPSGNKVVAKIYK